MIKKSHNIKINSEEISCNILFANNLAKSPEFVFLHGAGTGVKERIESISTPIIQAGLNILAFDFSGHGKSTGDIKKSSLKKRVEETTGMIDHFCGLFQYEMQVFVFPAWREIYTTDDERKMSFEQAEDFGIKVNQIYRDYGYTTIDVPSVTAEERAQFIIDRVATAK